MGQKSLAKKLKQSFPVDARLFRKLAAWEEHMPVDLLRAALLPDAEAFQAFQAFQARSGGIDFYDPIQAQLLPQLHANIGHLLDVNMAAKLKQLRIVTLVANRWRQTEMESVAEIFGNAGLPVLAFKGAAMTQFLYRDAGCRPMSDLDLLVKEEHFGQACCLLDKAGWEVGEVPGVDQPVLQMQINNARNYYHPQLKVHLDLHVHISHRACHAGADEEYWSRAVDLVPGSTLLRLCDTDNLLQTCVHGAQQNDTPPVRWAMDAYLTMLRPKEGIDWDLLLAVAQRKFFAAELLLTLTWVRQNLGAPVPDRVLNELASQLVCKHNLKIWSYSFCPPRSAFEVADYHWHRFWLTSRGLTRLGRLKFIPVYLMGSQYTNSYKAFASVVTTKLLKNTL